MADKGPSKIITAVTLEYPVKFGEETITVVQIIKRLQAKDLKGINLQNLSVEAQAKLIATISDCEYAEVMKIDMADFNKLTKILLDFLGGGQETGEDV